MTVSRSRFWLLVAGLLLFSASLLANETAVDPTLPKCPANWRVEAILQTPKILHPSVVCCAPDGRIFMGEDPMDMGNDSKKPTDRILCIFPDGKVTVFAEGLHAVFGLQYIDGKLYVHHVPKFSVFTDVDGVGRDRVDLIDCTNPNPAPGFNDHIPANCRLAMDGFLYVSTGDKGIYGAVGKDGKTAEIYGGGVFRMRPDGTDLEVYSTGTRNHLDVAINGEDEIFTYDNTDDGNGWWTRVTHMVDGGFYGYPYDYKPQRPYTLWMMTDYGSGSGTGAIAYNEDALPAEYQGNAFVCDWARKQVLRLSLARDGGSYKVAEREDFLTPGTAEFRPVGLAISPDGLSLLVTDWNFGGWKRNEPAGRLLKVTYTGASQASAKPTWYVPAATGKKCEAPLVDLIAGLSHPAQSVRLVAQRRLAERGAEATVPLTQLLANQDSPAVARWSAIWTLDAMDGGKAGRAAIVAALADPEASVRRQAARELGTRHVSEAVAPLIALLDGNAPLAADPSVRFQAATALGRIGDVKAVGPLLNQLGEPDLFTRYAVFTALNRIGRADRAAWPLVAAGLKNTDPRVREGTLFALRETFEEPVVRELADYAAAGDQPAAARAAALGVLADLARQPKPWDGKWWGTQPVKSPRPARTVDWSGTSTALAALRSALADGEPSVLEAAVLGLQAAKDQGSADKVLEIFTRVPNPEVRRAVFRFLAATKSAGGEELVLNVLRTPDKNVDLLLETVGAAEQFATPACQAALVELTAGNELPSDILVVALTALGKLRSKAAVPALVDRLGHPDALVRQAAMEALVAVGGQQASGNIIGMLDDKSAPVRRSAIQALGTLHARDAVPRLLALYRKGDSRFEISQALAEIPDVSAVDIYMEGLASKNTKLRDLSAKAIAKVGIEALPLVEARLNGKTPPEVVMTLQQIFSERQPITNWSLLGPLPNPTPEPFSVSKVDLNAQIKDSRGQMTRWKPAKLGKNPPGHVNLASQMNGVTSDATAYALAEINAPAASEVDFVAGSDDSLTLWLNGQQIFEASGSRGYKADDFHIHAKLQAGKNVLLAKIGQFSGGWEFSVSYLAPRKGPLFEIVAKQIEPATYATYALKNPGDAEHGRQLFSDLKGVACIKCHKVRGVGGDVGPDLLGVGVKYNRAQLVDSLLYPSKQILDGYRQTTIVLDDGTIRNGIIRGESEDSVTLVDAEGKKQVISKSTIDDRKESARSLMPDGLNTGMSLQDVADIVSFLDSLKDKGTTGK